MLEQGRGSIVSLSSDAGHMPGPYFVDYALTKGMVRLLSKALASEFAARGIRSNTVSPGPTRTAPWESGEFIDALAAEWEIDREAAIERFVRDVRGDAARAPRRARGRRRGDRVPGLRSRAPGNGADYRIDGGLVPTA